MAAKLGHAPTSKLWDKVDIEAAKFKHARDHTQEDGNSNYKGHV
jgi:hypothetical protein